jgi:hypothetical protein
VTDTPLFDGYEPAEPPPPLSTDRRRTVRQAAHVAAGVHPLTGGPIHPLASRHRDASAPKDDPFTCGSCLWRQPVHRGNWRGSKCYEPGTQGADDYEQHGPPLATHSAATDVRAWWPACQRYSPGDPGLGPDAARSIPGSDGTP